MKKILFLATMVIQSQVGFGQAVSGVHFELGLNWQQILLKAKEAHKFIFVDCYATWCAPCKEMDRAVYPVDSVGKLLNDHFVCIKMQMDRTPNDDATVKALYGDAKMLETGYNVGAYPTFLFFDLNGKAVHRAVGFMDAGGLITTARNAMEPAIQYYTLLNAYNAHQLDFKSMPVLAKEANAFSEKNLVLEVATRYMHGYLDKLNEKDLLTKNNVDFIGRYIAMVTPGDRLFKLCYNEPAKVDGALHNSDYANWLVNSVIYHREITPQLKAGWNNGPEPDWNAIQTHIIAQYGQQYVETNMRNAKINWYMHVKDGKNYTHYLTLKLRWVVEKYGISDDALNNPIFEIFEYDNDKSDLQVALDWASAILKADKDPNPCVVMDTKANLLYKLGEKQAAISLETQAAKLSPQDEEIAEALKKMLTGKPTWPANGMQ
jgi:thioredoxin-related protein